MILMFADKWLHFGKNIKCKILHPCNLIYLLSGRYIDSSKIALSQVARARDGGPPRFLEGPVSVLVLGIPPLRQKSTIWVNSLLLFIILLVSGWVVVVFLVGGGVGGRRIEAWVPGRSCLKPCGLVTCDWQCFFTCRAQEGTRRSRWILITARDTHTSPQAAVR